MRSAHPSCLLGAVIAAGCFACGDRSSLDSDTRGDAAGASVTLRIPLGSYSGCSSTMVTVGPNFAGVSGGDGSIMLAQEGEGMVAATLAFAPFASGKVAFTPTSGGTAAFAAGQSFDVDTVDFRGSNVVTVTATTGALMLTGDTLFVSVHGKSVGADEVSGYFHCPVPASLVPTSIVANAAPGAPLTAGVYGPCTSTVGAIGTTLGGGSGTVTITTSAGTRTATWNDGLTPVCGSLAFTATSGSVATLVAGQTCTLHEPCGPPPSLGPPSPVPSTATLTSTAGSMTVDGHSLFIDVLGDTPALTCGRHYVSIICAGD